jgi:hypothetical protein
LCSVLLTLALKVKDLLFDEVSNLVAIALESELKDSNLTHAQTVIFLLVVPLLNGKSEVKFVSDLS